MRSAEASGKKGGALVTIRLRRVFRFVTREQTTLRLKLIIQLLTLVGNGQCDTSQLLR